METQAVQQLVLTTTLLLLVAAAVAAGVKRIKLPYTVSLVITGAVIAICGRQAAEAGLISSSLLDGIELTPGIVLYVLLPILIFDAAFNLDSRRLLKNLLPIVTLAVPAVIVSTALVGLVLWAFGDVPHSQGLIAALLFGAMVSTTDAVAVVAIFRELGAPRRLTVLVEGEALFNSGTALVVFSVIASVLLSSETLSPGALLLRAVWDFLFMALGGVLAGIALGFVCSRLIGMVRDDPLIEITLSTVCAPLSFIIGGALGVSDVMAVIGAGLTVGNYGRTKISPSSLEPLGHYWHYLAFVANSLIFLLVGFSLRAETLLESAGVIGVAIVAVLVARAAGIFPLVALVNKRLPHKIDLGIQTIMWWGGIRGALVLVMALSLSQFDAQVLAAVGGDPAAAKWVEWVAFKEYVLHLAFGIVFFTILVQATSVKGLIRVLGLTAYTPSERFEEKGSLLLAKRGVRERLGSLRSAGVLAPDLYAQLVDRYMLLEGRLRKDLADLRQGGEGFTVEDERRTILVHCLGGEKAHLQELFERGDLGEAVIKDLHILLENEIDRLRMGEEVDEVELARLGRSRLREWVDDRLVGLLGTGRVAAWLRRQTLDRQYEAARARLSAIEAVTGELDLIERAEGASEQTFRAVREFYVRQQQAVRDRLESMNELFPAYAAEVQEALSERFCLRTEEEVVRWLAARGRLSAKVMTDAVGGIRDELDRLQRAAPSELMRPLELVQRISFFRELTPELVEGLARILLPITFGEGEVIVREGAAGDRMFLIARGSVEVVVTDDGNERVLDTLEQGDFFGEIALLSDQPRTATVRAREACALLELRRRDLDRLTMVQPSLRNALEEAYRVRVLSTALARLEPFAELTAEERGTLVESFNTLVCPPGQVLQRAGVIGDALLFVKRGRLRVGEGEEALWLEEGSFLGQEVVFFPAPAEAQVVAGPEETEVVVLRHLALQAWLRRDAAAREKVTAGVLGAHGRPLGG